MRATFLVFVGGRHAGDLTLWNQKSADSGSFLFASMARSHSMARSTAWQAPVPCVDSACRRPQILIINGALNGCRNQI